MQKQQKTVQRNNKKQNIPISSTEDRKEYDRQYRQKNNEKIRQYNQETYARRNLLPQRKNREEIITYKGGKCQKCGISFDGTNAAIFDLHHTDPASKEKTISGSTLSTHRDEIDRCILLCKNCHALIHYALTDEKFGLRLSRTQPERNQTHQCKIWPTQPTNCFYPVIQTPEKGRNPADLNGQD